MTTTTNTNLVKVYNCKSQRQAETDTCRATAEDWMYGQSFEVNHTSYQYYIDPATGENVMLEITVDTISLFQITQIMLRSGETTVYNWANEIEIDFEF